MVSSNISMWIVAALTALQISFASAQSAGPIEMKGCFSSSKGLTFSNTYTWQTQGWCQTACLKLGKPVMGLTAGSDCWCGDTTPPSSAKIDDSSCQHGCNGFHQACGGDQGTFGVYSTGLSNNVQAAVDDNSQSSSAQPSQQSSQQSQQQQSTQTSTQQLTTTATQTASAVQTTLPPSVLTVGGGTSVVTVPGSTVTQDPSVAQQTSLTRPQQQQQQQSSGTSTGAKVGIAVGVVGGVLALAALIAAFFYYKKKNSNDVVGRHRRNTSTNPFNDQSLEGTRNASLSDSRLDPTMVERERRLSNGSVFADNEDYSRRILKVTN